MKSLSQVTAASFLKSGGRIIRRRQGRRTITIAYSRENGKIRYGATIHNRRSSGDQFNRKEHNDTAIARYMNAPVIFDDITAERVEERDDYVRSLLLTHGCFSNESPWLNPTAHRNTETNSTLEVLSAVV